MAIYPPRTDPFLTFDRHYRAEDSALVGERPAYLALTAPGHANFCWSDPTRGDGSHWKFGLDTVEPDITAIELVRIMGMVMDLPDGMMTRIKSDPRLIRHFRRVGPGEI